MQKICPAHSAVITLDSTESITRFPAILKRPSPFSTEIHLILLLENADSSISETLFGI
jgi:hypothetical protein